MLFHVLTNSKWFLKTDYCSYFFKIPVDRVSIFNAVVGVYTWTTLPLVTLRPLSFLTQAFYQGLGTLTFHWNSVLIQYVDALLLWSPKRIRIWLPPFSVYSSSHIKVISFWWKRLQLLREKVHYLGHDLIAKGISLSSEITKAAPSFL